jgi:hypothetical protein
MGIRDVVQKFRRGRAERSEKKEARRDYKREMEKEKWRAEGAKYQKEKSYYEEKSKYEKAKSEAREQRIQRTPVVGTIYRSAKGFDVSKFAKATVDELAPPKRGRAAGKGGKSSRGRVGNYARAPAAYQPMNQGYNPVEENLRMQQNYDMQMRMRSPSAKQANSVPNIGVGVSYPSQSRAYKQPKISANGGIDIGLGSSGRQPKISKELRKLMGV